MSCSCTKILDILAIFFQLLTFAISIALIVFLFLNREDFPFIQTDNYLLASALFIPLVFVYRSVVILVFYILCFLLVIILSPLIFCFCICCHEQTRPLGSKFAHYMFDVARKFCTSSLEFFDVFVCFKLCIPKCVVCFQPFLNIIGLIIDLMLLVLALAYGYYLKRQLIEGGNKIPLYLTAAAIGSLLLIVITNFIRLIKKREVQSSITPVY